MGCGEHPAELQNMTPGKWRLALQMADGARIEVVTNGQESWEQTPGGTETTPAAFFAQLDPAFSQSCLLDPATRLVLLAQWGGAVLEDYRPAGGIAVPFAAGVAEGRMQFMFHAREALANVPVAAEHFVKESNPAAYRAAQREANSAALEKWGQGIDFGPARAVLENLGDFSAQDGRILYDAITAKGYRRGLEIGTARGNSAIWMGLAFKKTGGRLITLERNAERAAAAKENFRKAGLDGVVECRVNDAFEEIPRLEGTFDWVFMDTGAPLHQRFLEMLYPRLEAGGTVSSHNANDLERMEPGFLKAITTDPNLETRITRTPSGGVSMSAKKQ
jgi:predicted O-methyltransferase YrrM